MPAENAPKPASDPLRLVRYLASLTTPKLVLWCYLIWWFFTASRYFDPSPRLWLSSCGLSAIIGTALYLSTAYGTATKTELERWQIIRLYLMPFCVSSFAALIKDRGFVLVFDPSLGANLEGLSYCTGFVALALIARRLPLAAPAADPAPREHVGDAPAAPVREK